MGAINFSIDRQWVINLKQVLDLTHFVETGTFKGETLDTLKNDFAQFLSIELSMEHYETVKSRFRDHKNTRVINGDSAKCLNDNKDFFINNSTLFWLDAHWCEAASTAGKTSQCPLIDELSAIGNLNEDSVIMIDDARLFLAPPLPPHEISDWPSFHEVLSSLLRLSLCHEVSVVNDVIIFYPKTIKASIKEFGRNHGVDLLKQIDLARASELYAKQALEKEHVIHDLSESLRQRDVKIKSLSSPWWKKLRRSILKIIFKTPHPLGVLYQYNPRPLALPPIKSKITTKTLPGFCILTPSYNQGAFLERTLLSVLNQNYAKLRYGVQDGGSTDESQEIIRKYSAQLSYFDSRLDKGQADAINYGFSKMDPQSDEIMAWLNSDDVLLPGALHYVATFFAENPDVDVVYGHRIIIDYNDQEVGRWYLPNHDSGVIKLVDYIPQETLFWRSKIWATVGGLNTDFQFALDWDFLLRIQDYNYVIKRLNQFIGCFRVHSDQKTNQKLQTTGKVEMNMIRAIHSDGNMEHDDNIKLAVIKESRRSAIQFRMSNFE